MSSPSELSLDCKPQSYYMLLKSFGENLQSTDQTQKLEEFLGRLEEERLKIDAFKRELPLCMQLLNNAVEVYRQQLQAYRGNSNNQGTRPVLEEFIPLKNNNSENNEKSDKANWMTNSQLWSQSTITRNNTNETKPSVTSMKENTEIALNASSPKLGLDAKQRNGGAFHPFSKERALPELALSNSSEKEMEDVKIGSENSKACGNVSGAVGAAVEHGSGQNGNLINGQTGINNNNNSNIHNISANNGSSCTTTTTTTTTTQTHRKARRCWSPDLHRRFVNALQMLGGSQVATPKQIRELMKVDGLTNDEVKSHLQKYRLHTRRPSPSPQAAGGPAPHLVVLGGIWVPPEYATAAAAAHGSTSTLYHHHPTAVAHPPPHFCAPTQLPQEFYTTAAAPLLPPPIHHQHQHHHHSHSLHHYKASTSSPESPEPRGAGGDCMTESAEEGKSESSSWKAGESGGERKGLAALKEEGEESNGSEITLKF